MGMVRYTSYKGPETDDNSPLQYVSPTLRCSVKCDPSKNVFKKIGSYSKISEC